MSGDALTEGFLEMVQAAVARRAAVMEPHGWQLEVTDQSGRGTQVVVQVEMSHPLRPETQSFGLTPADSAVAALERWFDSLDPSVEIEGVAVARPTMWPLLRGLRAAAWWPRGVEASDAIRSAGYALYESAILSFPEATWLDAALDHDQREGPPR